MTMPLEVLGLGYDLRDGDRGAEKRVGPSCGRVLHRWAREKTLVLLGRSGSGKTTTLKLINACLEPTCGEVRVAGERAADLPVTRLRRRIGYVIQEVGLFPHFTVERNVGLVPQLEAWPPARIAARRCASSWRSWDSTRHLCDAVSPRAIRRTAPAGGVAPPWRPTRRCCCWTSRSARSTPSPGWSCSASSRPLEGRLGKGMVFVTHDVREGLLLGTRIGLMLQGRLAFLGTPTSSGGRTTRSAGRSWRRHERE